MRKFFLLLTINILVCTIDTYCISFLDIDTCSVSIITNDTIIYSDTPTTVQIQLQATQGADYYFWSPSTGVSDPTIPNPIATINSTTQFTLESHFLIDSNLVYNGGFELGNTGFTTQYNYSASGGFVFGNYRITSNAHTVSGGFTPCNNGGNYMVLDGIGTPNTYFYQSTVNVEPNTLYEFSVQSVFLAPTYMDPSYYPVLKYFINTEQLGPLDIISNYNCNWHTFTYIWNSGNNTTATIKIIDDNTDGTGNDFAVDNVCLKKFCKATDTINISILETPSQDSCSIQINDDSIIYTDTAIDYQLYSLPEADYYRWTPPQGFPTQP